MTYDASASTITLNGTWSGGHHFNVGNIPITLDMGHRYRVNLTYVSGSYTTSTSGVALVVQPATDSADIQGNQQLQNFLIQDSQSNYNKSIIVLF